MTLHKAEMSACNDEILNMLAHPELMAPKNTGSSKQGSKSSRAESSKTSQKLSSSINSKSIASKSIMKTGSENGSSVIKSNKSGK